MESKSHLEHLRYISENQLEALLRYDSPPETQPPDEENDILNEKVTTKIMSDDIYLIDNIDMHNNGHPLTEMNSQIDFSVFHNVFSNDRSNDCDDYAMETIEKIDTIVCEKEKAYNDHDNMLEFEDSNKKNDYLKFPYTSQDEKYEDDFHEIHNIYKKLDFFNIQKSLLDKHIINQATSRLCHTQINIESSSNPNEKVTSSCPLFPVNNNQFSQNMSSEGTYTSISSDAESTKNEMENIFENVDLDHISDYIDYNRNQPQNIKDHCINIDNETTCTPYDNSIPFSVRQLYNIVKTKYSDFAFIYALSSQLCQDRVPIECFVTLKMGLLLSLVSIANNINRPPIPVVAITSDSYMTDYLMRNIGQLGLRFMAPFDDQKNIFVNNWVQADPFLMARGGVYYAGDWTRLKLKKTETIFKNIECSTVVLEKSAANFPLEAAIWTHWRSFKYSVKDQQMFNKFLKIFGIPIFVSDDNHEVLVDYTLEQTSVRFFESTVDHLSINEDDMRNFLINVSQSTVDLSAEAELLLKNYFVASRSNRTDCLSKQSYVILKQFAESFAKLSMHNEVLFDDAVAAIIICEHFIENTFNSCGDSPPHFGNFYFVGAVDEYFCNFKKWLQKYINK